LNYIRESRQITRSCRLELKRKRLPNRRHLSDLRQHHAIGVGSLGFAGDFEGMDQPGDVVHHRGGSACTALGTQDGHSWSPRANSTAMASVDS